MRGLFHFFAFAALVIVGLILWAILEHGRNRRKAERYIREKLGMAGTPFKMARFVRMARIVQPETGRLTVVFYLHDKHITIDDFEPTEALDLGPDTVMLVDKKRNLSWYFADRSGKIYASKLENFTPDTLLFIRVGTGRVVFESDKIEIPGGNRDWFLVDAENAAALRLAPDDSSVQGEVFSMFEGFGPTEGCLESEQGQTILADWETGVIALRPDRNTPFRLYDAGDIESVAPSGEREDVLV
ncbi:MAG: hypothetical protein U9R40_05640, partial [Synergistota bacterium]|nr:hypothetical protein [Synergistota bacterium]